MKSGQGRPSLRKLARLANVSPSTVSRALSGKEGVSPETRARVLVLAQEMGLVARDAVIGRPQKERSDDLNGGDGRAQRITAALIIDSRSNPGLAQLVTEPFYTELVAGLYEGGRRYHADLQLVTVDSEGDLADAIEREVDGVIWLGYNPIEGFEPWISRFFQRGIAVVLCDHYVPDLPCDAVLSDNVGGAYQAATYVARLGHRRVSILGQDLPSTAAVERVKGALAGLVQSGISPQEIQIIIAPPSFDGGYATLDRALEFGATAVLCGNDTMALGVIRRAFELGVNIPGDLSVVGFDDIATSSKVTPALTTVRVDKLRLGIETVRRLRLAIVEKKQLGIEWPPGSKGGAVRSLVPTRLIERESTGALAGAESAPINSRQPRSTQIG